MATSAQGTNPQNMMGAAMPQGAYQPMMPPQMPPPAPMAMGGGGPQVPLPAPDQSVDARRQMAMDRLRQVFAQAQAQQGQQRQY